MVFKNNEFNEIPGYPENQRQRDEIAMCEYFIEKYFIHSRTYDREHSSYNLKHQVENWAKVCHDLGVDLGIPNYRYVSNEAFITAAYNMGFVSKPCTWNSPNLLFKYRYVGPKIFSYERYVVPMSYEQWKCVLDVRLKKD